MAQLQYIGARYVPVWYHNSLDDTSNWEVNVEYEPLTFVTSLNNHLYLSKKTVPDNIGTPADNTDYWLDMGVFSGGANLQEQIDDIVADIGDLDDLSTTDKTSIVNAINEVAGNVPTERAKKYVIITDSYGNRMTTDSKTVGDILTDRGNDIAYYHAISGGGFTASGSLNPTYYLNDYTGDHDEITDVYFCMSANDNGNDVSAIISAVYSAVNDAKTAYPNAAITIIPWGVAFVNTEWAANLLDITLRGYRDGANAAGAAIAENAQYMLRYTALLDSDLIHPNSNGVITLANFINGYMHGSPIDVIHRGVFTLTPDNTDITDSFSVTIKMYRHNGVVVMTTDSAAGLFANSVHAIFNTSKNYNPAFSMTGTVYSRPQFATDKYYPVNCRCHLNDNSGWCGGVLNFSIYEGGKVRMFELPDSKANVNAWESFDNTVILVD